MSESSTGAAFSPQASIKDYVAIARLDHVTKHVFVIPGLVLAYALRGIQTEHLTRDIFLGFVCVIAIASANYVINEYLDREFDKFHPTKSSRTALQVKLSAGLIFVEWLALVSIGILAAASSSKTMVYIAAAFAIQGIVYNVRPIRSKEKAYLDVISESVNNPIRLMVGWAIIDPFTLPPSSILGAYWFGGAFLMAAKRLSEYREISSNHGRDLLVKYRASFAGYSENSLMVSCLIYACMSSFVLAVFLIKYRIEYLISFPAFAALFGIYFSLSMHEGSVAQKPEHTFKEPRLIWAVGILVALTLFATFVDLPFLHRFAEQEYIQVR